MAPGRTVPWCCWEEWYLVRDWLLSQSHDDIRRGIQRVEAWRARGRMPLGVDITASLLETALCDASFWGPPAATVMSSTAAVAAAGVSQQQIRLQYSATLVRMVNGIADSQQKGRVALSVNSLAEAAGLSRLLVDVRHEATHNELPSLSTLQLAAKQALDWLASQYWQRQADHLQACHVRVQGILKAVFDSCKAAAAKSAAATAAADGDDECLAGQDELGQPGASGYNASEGRKQRKLLLAELKGLVPPSHTPLLANLLLQSSVLQALQPEEQQDQQQQRQIRENAPHVTALTALYKQYPDLKVLLLEEAVCRLADLAQQQQQQEQQGVHQLDTCSAGELAAWLRVLLPSETAAAAAPCSSKATSSRSKSKQQQQQRNSICAEQTGGAAYTPAFISQLLAKVVKARQAAAAGSSATAGSHMQQLQEAQHLLCTALATATSSTRQPAGAGGSSSSSSRVCILLQQLAELAAPQGLRNSSQGEVGLGAGGAIKVAGNTSSKKQMQKCSREQQQQQGADWQQQQKEQQGADWQQQQKELLQEARVKQQQLIMQQQQQQQRKRKRGEQDTAAAAAAAAAETPRDERKQRRRWQKVAHWSPCAIGCLPSAHRPQDLLTLLHKPAVGAAAACDKDAAATAAQQLRQDAYGAHDAAAAAANELQPFELALLEHEQAAVLDAATAAACVGSQFEQQVEVTGAADLGDGAGTIRFGQHWQLSKQDLRQLQQTVRALL